MESRFVGYLARITDWGIRITKDVGGGNNFKISFGEMVCGSVNWIEKVPDTEQ
jgi:hypothetical protein